VPDTYRTAYCASNYEQRVQATIDASNNNIAAFFCESVLSCAGQIVLPPGFLKQTYQQVRNAGGVCVADEVQVGFGRVGSHFWAFEMQQVVPDIVTLGKRMSDWWSS
jgi:4-aminobutyrate aminotransferase-like enzyme